MFFNTEDLVSSAKRSEFFPVSQGTFSDPDDLIAFANEEMQTKMVPFIMSNRQDFFLTYKLISLVSGLIHYGLPERCIGNAFKDIFFLPTAGDVSVRWPIPKVEVHDSGLWTGGSGVMPAGFHMQGDEVVLLTTPTSSVSGQLMVFYFRRPSELVPTSSCAKITAVSSVGGTTTFTVDTDLTASLSIGSLVDINSAKSPFLPWSDDVAITAITSTTIAVATSAVTNEGNVVEPQLNDYICPAQQTNIPQIPSDFHPILSEMICYRVLKAIKDKDGMSICMQNITDMLKMGFKLIENRVESEVDTVFDQNSLLSSVSNSGYRSIVR